MLILLIFVTAECCAGETQSEEFALSTAPQFVAKLGKLLTTLQFANWLSRRPATLHSLSPSPSSRTLLLADATLTDSICNTFTVLKQSCSCRRNSFVWPLLVGQTCQSLASSTMIAVVDRSYIRITNFSMISRSPG